ncbi:MAG: FxLYD domain-containing protein [Nitrososphaera sp.]
MKSIVLAFVFAMMLLTTNLASAQNLPPSTSIDVKVLPAYSYKADDGTTVVLGEVENDMASPVNNVSIGVSFEDDNNNVIEYKTGTTLLQVIPAGGKGQFMISSKADSSITQVSVKLAGFRSSPDKPQVLSISNGIVKVSDGLLFSVNIKNNGALTSANTKLYFISYDAFQRVVGIGVSEPINIDSGKQAQVSISDTLNPKARSYAVVAESDSYQSKISGITNIQITLPVMVSNTVATDVQGNAYSSIPVGSQVKITSNIRYVIGNSTQPFVYYVEVKQFGGQVDFIGKYEGVFLDTNAQSVSVIWTPQSSGSYYIETYVWTPDDIPLSSAGTRINLALVQ